MEISEKWPKDGPPGNFAIFKTTMLKFFAPGLFVSKTSNVFFHWSTGFSPFIWSFTTMKFYFWSSSFLAFSHRTSKKNPGIQPTSGEKNSQTLKLKSKSKEGKNKSLRSKNQKTINLEQIYEQSNANTFFFKLFYIGGPFFAVQNVKFYETFIEKSDKHVKISWDSISTKIIQMI